MSEKNQCTYLKFENTILLNDAKTIIIAASKITDQRSA